MRTENSSNKIFIIIIGLLLISNIGTVVMLMVGKKDSASEHKNAMRNYLKNEIGFSAKQLQDFDTIKSQHRAQVKLMFEEMQKNKQNNLKAFSNAGFSDSALQNAAMAAAAEQQNVELNMLKHLRDVRALCTPAQRTVFDTGFYKIMAKPPGDPKNK